MALSARSLTTLPPGFHGDGGNLFLLVGKTGGRSWIFRFQKHGRRRDMGLGPIALVSLSDARRRAVECREMLFRGIDPLEQKHGQRAAEAVAAAKATTFEECAQKYLASHRAGWRSRTHARVFEHWMRDHVLPVLGKLSVDAIDTGLVMKAIEPIWTEKPATASRVRGAIEAVLNYATTHGWRTGDNPARWRGHLENLLPERSKVRRVEHHAALSYPEIGAFMNELRNRGTVGAAALEFLILTAARTGEALGAKWGEINMAERVWTVPPDRMKSGKEHRVPLSEAAIAIVERMAKIRTSDFVFPGQRSGHPLSASTALLAVLRRMGRGDLTTHGFRSTFRDWAEDLTSYPAIVAEMSLAHTVGSDVERAYRRTDLFNRRRRLMDDWAQFCAAPGQSGEVVPIRA